MGDLKPTSLWKPFVLYFRQRLEAFEKNANFFRVFSVLELALHVSDPIQNDRRLVKHRVTEQQFDVTAPCVTRENFLSIHFRRKPTEIMHFGVAEIVLPRQPFVFICRSLLYSTRNVSKTDVEYYFFTIICVSI